MKIIGRGSARGGISILHAAGLGKGCSVGVDLFTEVQLVDSEIVVEYDRHGILKQNFLHQVLMGLSAP